MMKFNQELAGKICKKSCKKCWGRGYVISQHSAGSPILNQKEKDGVVIVAGSAIFVNVNYCLCVDKKIDKIKKIMKIEKEKQDKMNKEKKSQTDVENV